jgi:two-component system NarL family response regulator
MSDPIRLLLVDDHQIVRMGLKAVLRFEPDLEVVAEAGDASTALLEFERHSPDVTLLDLRMPGGGLETLRQLRSLDPESRVLILTTSEREEDVHQALAAGARGYALKSLAPEQLAEAIRVVYSGHVWIPPDIARIRAAREASPELSSREMQVLHLLVKGLTNLEIADALGVSRSTIKVHVAHILEKLGVADRTEAAAEAFRRGILTE